jgi:hypothetical protein
MERRIPNGAVDSGYPGPAIRAGRRWPWAADRIRAGVRNFILPQLVFVLIAWLFVVGLHWQNDGLWFQGDSPRHAANGLFWKDLLLSGSLAPKDYALRYYARYPVISPVNYPPVFYILEGTLFAASKASPYVAKGLVLGFALLAACYLLAWLRRWVAAEAGWAAALLILLPGFVRWSNSVMLNVPATALSLAALYHAKRWMESSIDSGARRQLFLTVAFSLSAILTHFVAGILLLVIFAWMLSMRRWDLLWTRRTFYAVLISGALLLPFIGIASKWAPTYVAFVTQGLARARLVSSWTFYPENLLIQVGPFLLAFSALGLILGAVQRKWRQESLLLLVFLMTAYAALSMIRAKDSRYGLLLCIPIVGLCAIPVQTFAEWCTQLRICRKPFRTAFAAALVLCLVQGRIAAKTLIPRIQGIREAVAFLERVAPSEPVFYDGYYHNVFTFYVQSGDPSYKRRVVLGAKLIYASAINPMSRYVSYVSSPEEVVQALQERGGCRWLAIEISRQSGAIPAAVLLRQAVQGPEFEKIGSFPVSGPGLDRIEIYRLKTDPLPVQEADLPFPILGRDARFKVRPIQR